MKLQLGRWSRFLGQGDFAEPNEPSFAGISGGRTSAMMAALCPPSTIFSFQNTGKEHTKTYEFLERLEDALERHIVWLEVRPPSTRGAPPKEFRHEVVTPRTANRKGEPFETFMRCIAEYRAEHKDGGAISPWARQRICTAYMKMRVQDSYVRSLGVECYTRFVGMRHDEPTRVEGLRQADTTRVTHRAPLFSAGIVKSDVHAFWAKQSFDLEIEEFQGNCTGCFLKDEADLARAMGDPDSDAAWWIAMERKYPGFGGRRFRGYENLLHELPTRQALEQSLRSGSLIRDDGRLDPRRFHLVMLQEKRRVISGPSGISCACEASLISEEDNNM